MRKAANSAFEAEAATMKSKHSAEKAKLKQEQAEMLRLVDENIAAEEDGFLFEAQFEEGFWCRGVSFNSLPLPAFMFSWWSFSLSTSVE